MEEGVEEYAAFTLLPSTYVHAAVTGSFTEPKVEEVAIVRGAGILEVARLGPSGSLETQVVKKTFSTIRSIQPFRPVGLSKDLLLLGSDSGVVTLVEAVKEAGGQFRAVAQLKCGPQGFRRDVPGEYVAADPSGRAIMAVSVGGHKVVATVVAEGPDRVSIQKPASFKCRMGTGGAGKPAVVYSVVGLEVGTEAPSFAVLAANDGAGDQMLDDPEEKRVTVYCLDMERNEVVQLWRQPASRTGVMLAPVPRSDASDTRPVFVLSENWVAVKDQKRREIRAALPRRVGLSKDRGVLPVASALARPKGGEGWVLLVQSELGDVYTVSLEEGGQGEAVLHVTVMDTIPRCTALVVLAGAKVLWAAAEFGDQAVYGLTSLEGEGVSCRSLRDSDPHHLIGDGSRQAAEVAEVFEPTPMLSTLREVTSVNNTAPVTYLRSVAGRLVAFCGGGRASSMRVFTSGLPVTADPAGALPPGSKATGMWTAVVSGEQYLLVSFDKSTSVWRLAAGQEGELRFQSLSREEAEAVGFVSDAKTVEVGGLEDAVGTTVQVLEDSRFRRLGIQSREWEWRVPGRRLVGRAAMGRQCLVLACGGELYCFRFPGPSSEMVTYEPHDVMVDISAVAVSTRTAADGGQHGEPLVFAACLDLSLQVLGYGRDDNMMEEKGRVTLPDRAECLAHLPDGTLVIGLVSGAILRARLAPEGRTGIKVTLGRVTQVGSAPLRLFKVRAAGEEAVLALSGGASLLLYVYGGRVFEHNLAYSTPIHLATPFAAPENPECILALHHTQLSILQVEGYGAPFSERSLPLLGTPRGVTPVLSPPHLLAVLEGDDGGSPGIRIVDPVSCSTRQRIEMRPNDIPLCLAALRFRSSPSVTHQAQHPSAPQQASQLPTFVCVGGVTVPEKGHDGSGGGGWIDVYAVSERGLEWQCRYTHDITMATAMAALAEDGLLLVAVGPAVRVYDYNASVKKLFRRNEVKLEGCGPVTRLLPRGGLVVASDILRGVHCLQLSRSDASLIPVAEDRSPRLVTDICLYGPVRGQPLCIAGADKLGNLFLLRMPLAKTWPTAAVADPLSEVGQVRELESVLDYHVGEVVTSITNVKLGAQGTREALAYATVTGGVGVLMPLSMEEAELFHPLEAALRKQPAGGLSPTARDHLLYRSPVGPVRGVVDLDFCEGAGSAVRGAAAREAKVDRKELERRMAEVLGQVSQVVPD